MCSNLLIIFTRERTETDMDGNPKKFFKSSASPGKSRLPVASLKRRASWTSASTSVESAQMLWREKIKGNPVYTISENALKCLACRCTVLAGEDKHMSNWSRHDNSRRHLDCAEHFLNAPDPNANDIFAREYVEMMITSDIPFKKLDNPAFRNFNSKHLPWINFPDAKKARSIRDEIYDETREAVKQQLSNGYLYLMLDETKDKKGNFTYLIIVGILREKAPCYLLDVISDNEPANQELVYNHICNSLKKYFVSLPSDRLIAFVSDAASYMTACYKNKLLPQFPKLRHITCCCHGIDLVIKKLREKRTNTAELIDGLKIILHGKSNKRRDMYAKRLPDTPLPPKYVAIRWGTWLRTAVFVNGNVLKMRAAVKYIKTQTEKGEGEQVPNIDEYIAMLEDEDVLDELHDIAENYAHLADSIAQLEKHGRTANDALAIVFSSYNQVTDPVIKNKFRTVLEKNNGLLAVKDLHGQPIKVLNEFGKDETLKPKQIPTQMAPLTEDEAELLKFVPIVSALVERCFSCFSHVDSKRRNFKLENLRKHFFIFMNRKFLVQNIYTANDMDI